MAKVEKELIKIEIILLLMTFHNLNDIVILLEKFKATYFF